MSTPLTAFMTLPGIAFGVGLAVALVVILALEFLNSRRIERLASPTYEFMLNQAQQEADRVIAEARAEARAIVERAEAARAANAGELAKQDAAAASAHEEALRSVRDGFVTYLKRAADDTHANEEQALGALQTELAKEGEEARAELNRTLAEVRQGFAENVKGAFEAALAEARASAAAYEQARKDAIDAHAYELVAETTKLVLRESLPTDVHAALVRRALEAAKSAHVF
jgi:hypothetical protein